jgi:hypothetical protein
VFSQVMAEMKSADLSIEGSEQKVIITTTTSQSEILDSQFELTRRRKCHDVPAPAAQAWMGWLPGIQFAHRVAK